ncbi:MAG: hypothetical protein Q4B96_05290 [Bacillota bacterium]|nr:hypothetical protein [Bacillota bacterium]
MGIYKVNSDGRAPKGLTVGDLVVTGGGTYTITGVNSDGSYNSSLANAAQTTYNYGGGYNTAAPQTPAAPAASSSAPSLLRRLQELILNFSSAAGDSLGSRLANNAAATAPSGGNVDIVDAAARLNGIFRVNADGRAPLGLTVGDQVVTGGGTYTITGVNADGSYTSRLADAAQTTYNYQGEYDSYAPAPAPTPAAAPLSSYEEQLAELQQLYEDILEQTLNSSYQPLDLSTYTAPALSFEQAVQQAEAVLAPQYSDKYEQAGEAAVQALEKMGLYDSFYGQALSAEAQNDISRDLNAAIYALALQLMGASEEQAVAMAKLAMQENQFAANINAENRVQALNALYKLMQQQAALMPAENG